MTMTGWLTDDDTVEPECGQKFKTVSAAERAASEGCAGCGGVDIDIDTDATAHPPAPSAASTR
jgi:hypothetical protein